MDKNAVWKWLILTILVLLSVWTVTPPKEKIRYGLDLQGGTSFVVRIDEAKVISSIREQKPDITDEKLKDEVRNVMNGSTDRALEVIRNRIDNLGINEPVIYKGKDDRIIIQLPGVDKEKLAEAEIQIMSAAFLEFKLVGKESNKLVQQLFASRLAPEGYRIADGVNGLFYELDETFPPEKRNDEYKIKLKKFQVRDPGLEFMLEADESNGRKVFRPAFVERRTRMTGNLLKDADVRFDAMNNAQVGIAFGSEGRKEFGRLSSDYGPNGPMNPGDTGRQLAIVLDGTLYSAPYFQGPILDGNAVITGSFSSKEAARLANVLRSGALPAPIEILEKRFVDPSLGADSIKSGFSAIIYGGVAVLIFMLIYYMTCGVIADVALFLNMILLPLGMITAAGFLSIGLKEAAGSTRIQLPVLTLPGIAGILLTIGMAVDANVLIFERIREELKAGKRLWAAISAGYDKAFVTIMDANVTTLLTGAILFRFGSGPIRGFAVTLCAGIIVSMFTALVVTKLFFGLLASRTNMKTLKMLSVVGDTKINFVGARKIAAVISIAAIAASMVLLGMKWQKSPDSVLGVDFMGGSSLVYKYDTKQDVDELRNALDESGFRDAHIQYQSEIKQNGESFLQIKTAVKGTAEKTPEQLVSSVLNEKFPTAGFSIYQEDKVESQIGEELKMDALLSIGLALLGIIIYLSLRFEFGFAIGAIVALTHDVLMTVGLYSLFGKQISLPIIAALLTIVGYSVNDTIVVFDRIREDLRLSRNSSFLDICNLSINQTLSRTLLTSLTTLMTVVMLLVFGGGQISDFALALCIGVLVGTYSSIFVATPVVLFWYRGKKPDFASVGK